MLENVKQMELNYRRNGRKNIVAKVNETYEKNRKHSNNCIPHLIPKINKFVLKIKRTNSNERAV